MEKIIVFLVSVMCFLSLQSCETDKNHLVQRIDRITDEQDIVQFELAENESIYSVWVMLDKTQTTIRWKSTLQKEYAVLIGEACSVEKCDKNYCYIASNKTGNGFEVFIISKEEVPALWDDGD